MIFVGVDPGKSGGLAWLDESRKVIRLADAPLVKVGKRHEYDLAEMAQMLRFPAGGADALLAIEQVGSHKGEGPQGAFTFGTGFGIWLGIAAALRMRIERITPQRWRKGMMEGLAREKGASILRAKELFPDQTEKLTRKKDDGRAEALLIAEFARRTFAAAATKEAP